MSTVGEIYRVLDQWASFSTAESFDNSGLLIGGMEQPVSFCLLALDLTQAVCEEAAERGAQLVITHHPVIFDPLRRVDAESVVYNAVQAWIAVISTHTCMDKAHGGVSDVLAERLGLIQVEDVPGGEGFVKIGEPEELVNGLDLARSVKEKLGLGALRVYDAGFLVRKAAVCSGSGGSFLKEVIAAGADAYITGDIKHDVVVSAANAGLTLIDAGHYETEEIILEPIAKYLEKRFPEVQFERAKTDEPLFRQL